MIGSILYANGSWAGNIIRFDLGTGTWAPLAKGKNSFSHFFTNFNIIQGGIGAVTIYDADVVGETLYLCGSNLFVEGSGSGDTSCLAECNYVSGTCSIISASEPSCFAIAVSDDGIITYRGDWEPDTNILNYYVLMEDSSVSLTCNFAVPTTNIFMWNDMPVIGTNFTCTGSSLCNPEYTR